MEESWNFTPVVIPLVALLIGWVIGFFDSNRRTEKKIRQAEQSAKTAIQSAEDRLAQTIAQKAESPTLPYAVDDPGLMRIKNENGILTLDLDGERMIPNALTAEQRRRLVEMLSAIRPWLEGKPAIAPASMTPPKPAPTPIVTPPPPSATAQIPAAPAPATNKGTSSKKKKAEEPELPPTSIVGQINLILQAQIANTPLAARGVTLLESAIGGVNVYVGTNKYEGVDDVPEEEIKTAIRAAIAEWEKKYTPGLS
jgi:hypothetical protein